MRLKMRLHTIAFSTFLLYILSLYHYSAHAAIDGVWQLHPAADILSHTSDTTSHLNCVQILDGERYTYFRLRSQSRWNKDGYPDYEATHTSLLRYDKAGEATEGIRPLAYLFPTGGTDVQTATYSYEGKYLAIGYKNGVVDLIHDDGRRLSSSVIADYDRPVDKTVNSITCDLEGKTLSVATGFGYVTIDAATGETLALCDIYAPLLFAGKVGDRTVAFDATTAYIIPAGVTPTSLDSLTPLAIDPDHSVASAVLDDYTLKSPDRFFPLTDRSFLCVTPSDGSATSMVVVTLDDSADAQAGAQAGAKMIQTSSLKLNYTSYSIAANYRDDSYNEGLIVRSRDGVYNPGNGTPFIIRKGVDPDFSTADPQADFISRAKVTFAPFSSVEAAKYAPARTMYLRSATADGEHYWFFYPRQGFRRATLADGTYSMEGEILTPDASSCFVADAMAYHPAYGMMMRQHGASGMFGSTLSCQSDGLCAYRDGHWRSLSIFNDSKSRANHMRARNGIAVDPIDDRYIWSGSGSNGFYRQNLDNPYDVLHMGGKGKDAGPGRNDAWYVAIYTAPSGYWDTASYGCPKFDDDATMWVPHGNYKAAEEDAPVTELWYWTAENRAKCDRVATDHALYTASPMGVINVPVRGFSSYTEIFPMAHPVNANLIGIMPDQNQSAIIYDHNGTPADTSDDRIAYLEDIYDENLNPMTLTWPSYMFEDPYDGAILIAYNLGMLVTSRAELFAGTKRGRMLRPAIENSGEATRELPCTRVTGIDVDLLGRKWISTADDGIYCLSEDRTSILAHYNADSSDLPSDNCYTVCFNPETRTIWTGTAEGVAEFIPSGSEGTAYRTPSPKVSPAAVTPEYRGYITVSNLADGVTYSIVDKSGVTVMQGTPTAGNLQLENDGIAPGEYSVCDSEGTVVATFLRL